MILFSFAGTWGATTQVEIKNISTPQKDRSCPLPGDTPPQGIHRHRVTTECSLERPINGIAQHVPLCLASLVYPKIHRLYPCCRGRQQCLVLIATERSPPKSTTASQCGKGTIANMPCWNDRTAYGKPQTLTFYPIPCMKVIQGG